MPTAALPQQESLQLPGQPAMAVRWTRPATAARALVLHLHGGAFMAGCADEGQRVARVLADEGALVASLDYPLLPFPQPVEAAHAALAWLDGQRKRLKATGLPLLIAGEEAGGNLAAACALMVRDRGEPPLHGQILLSPMLDVCTGTASLRHAQAGPVGCPWADGWRRYLSQACDALHPYAAPGRAMRLAQLPPALLITAVDDPLRDETSAYAQRLRAAGVAVEVAQLAVATGWPRSYRDAAPAPWAEALRLPLRAFLRGLTEPLEPAAAASRAGPCRRRRTAPH